VAPGRNLRVRGEDDPGGRKGGGRAATRRGNLPSNFRPLTYPVGLNLGEDQELVREAVSGRQGPNPRCASIQPRLQSSSARAFGS
jgi:hypothetical protein